MTNSPGLQLAPSSHPTDFLRGLWLPVAAARLIARTPRLARWAKWASVVTALTLMTWVAVLVLYTDDGVRWLWAEPQSWYGRAAWSLATVVAFLALLVLGSTTLPLLLLAPLLDPVSEATEAALGTRPSGAGWRAAVRSTGLALVHTVQRVALLLAGQLLLLPLFLIPGVGSVASAVLGTAWTAAWLAVEYLDVPMARHLYSLRQVVLALRSRPYLSLGFGLALYAVLWVPILNLFLMPLATVAGTLLYRTLLDAGVLPLPGAVGELMGPRPA